MKEKIQEAVKAAMKARDKVKVETLRGVLTSIQYEEIEKKIEPLPNDAIIAVLQREIKKRKEEIDFATQAQRTDLLEKLPLEIAAIESFLPAQISSEELEKIVGTLKTEGSAPNLGAAMKLLKEKYNGQYDSKLASEICRKIYG